MAGNTSESESLDALLAEYSVGQMSPPAAALVSAHLDMRPESAAFVADLESAGGTWLDDLEPADVDQRDAILDAIFASDQERDDPVGADTATTAGLVPPQIAELLSIDGDDIPWKSRLGGIREVRRKYADGSSASLLWIRAGQQIPTHTHDGVELTLVLQGAFTDEDERYGPGDVAIADDDVDHCPTAEPHEDCICFVVLDAPLKFTGPVTRFLGPILNG